MKCGCYVKKTFTEGGKPRRPDVVCWMTIKDLSPYPDNCKFTIAELLAAGYVKCSGEIKVEVCADDVPDWGCTSSELNINYECAECKWAHYPELPDRYTISEFMTKLIASDSMNADVLQANHVLKLKEQDRVREEMMESAGIRRKPPARRKAK